MSEDEEPAALGQTRKHKMKIQDLKIHERSGDHVLLEQDTLTAESPKKGEGCTSTASMGRSGRDREARMEAHDMTPCFKVR